MANALAAVDARIAKMPQPQRDTLLALRATLRKLLPHAEEGLKYGMPSFLVQGKGVAAYDAFKAHCGYFPFSGSVLGRVGKLPAGLTTTKGGLQFPVDQPLPLALVKKLVRVRLDEIGEVTNGKRFEFYDDGAVKAVGGMKGGQLNGAWKWFRRDGTLMRTGSFKAGQPSGTWSTYDRAGKLVKATKS